MLSLPAGKNHLEVLSSYRVQRIINSSAIKALSRPTGPSTHRLRADEQRRYEREREKEREREGVIKHVK